MAHGHGHDHRPPPGGMEGHEHGPELFPPPLAPGDPGPKALRRLDPKLRAALLGGPRGARLTATRNPSPGGSFGYVNRFVRLAWEEGKRATPGTLVMALDPRRLGTVAPETLRAFRWSEEGGYDLVERSGVGQTGDYVWAQVREPGLYALIGVDADPLVARTLGLMSLMGRWLGFASAHGAGALHDRICELILCAPDMAALRDDPEVERALVEDNLHLGLPGRWPGGPRPRGESVCARCFGLPRLPRLPDAKILWPPELHLVKPCVKPPPQLGRWDVLPLVPPANEVVLAVHAALLRTGKVAYFGGSENVQAQHAAGGAAIDNTRLWDPATGTITKLGSPANHDLFCCGHAFLPDGRLLAAGGTMQWGGGGHPVHGGHFAGLRNASLFNPGFGPGTNPWAATAPLLRERGKTTGGGGWYPTLLTLPSGRVLKLTGHPEHGDTRHNNVMLETYDGATGAWSDEGIAADLPTPSTVDSPLYPRAHVLPDGEVFFVTPLGGPSGGPADRSWRWNPSTKAWTSLGSGPGPEYGAFDTTSVLLPLLPAEGHRARVLVMNRPDPKIIDLGAAAAAWQLTAPRTLRDPVAGPPVRYHATSVLLPDATVLLVGGHSDPNNWYPPVLAAELFTPATGTWSTMATAAVPRVYHSVALLLPDGRVWTAGSDYGNGSHESRMEVYSPPYLFRGPRPAIASAPSVVTLPSTFDIGSPNAPSIASAALLRCGSSTHAFNPDQRYVGLAIQGSSPTKLIVASPPNRNVAPPGYYLLFILDAQGVPSIGRFIRVA